VKAAQREPYLAKVRASEEAYRRGETKGWMLLCAYCKFFRSIPPAYDESYGDAECDHQLAVVAEVNFERAWEGADCWAFRPGHDPDAS
jgi:hypothetical protein